MVPQGDRNVSEVSLRDWRIDAIELLAIYILAYRRKFRTENMPGWRYYPCIIPEPEFHTFTNTFLFTMIAHARLVRK